METTIYTQLFKIPSQKFKAHIQLEANERILFSGKFGKGKTTFIKHFFEEAQSEYFNIHVSPVNYSVANNEDIFKYIKYDIILEFLKQGIEFEESDFNFMDTLPLFIRRHPGKIISKLLSFIPVVGKTMDDIYEKGKSLYDEMKKHTGEINSQGHGNQLESYLEEIEENTGSIYENDFTTKIIEAAINKLKTAGKKTVLIVDDIDRLDPEHIFRILNVFAAQFDNYSVAQKANKFNLDKIIIVCDLDNIRNIYKNRYGADVDFNGYVNKFYSKEPFYFNNYNELVEISYQILGQIRMTDFRETLTFGSYINNAINNNRCLIGINQIIGNLLFFDFISLRDLLNYSHNRSFELVNGYNIDDVYFENDDFCVIVEAIILNRLLGGFENAMHVLEKLEKISSTVSRYEFYYKMIFYFLTFPKAGHSLDSEGATTSNFEGNHFRYKISNKRIEDLQISKNGNWLTLKPTQSDYFKILKSLFIRIYQNGIIE